MFKGWASVLEVSGVKFLSSKWSSRLLAFIVSGKWLVTFYTWQCKAKNVEAIRDFPRLETISEAFWQCQECDEKFMPQETLNPSVWRLILLCPSVCRLIPFSETVRHGYCVGIFFFSVLLNSGVTGMLM